MRLRLDAHGHSPIGTTDRQEQPERLASDPHNALQHPAVQPRMRQTEPHTDASELHAMDSDEFLLNSAKYHLSSVCI